MTNWKKGDPFRNNSNPNILEGLPAISTFLGKSIGTVRNWIKRAGLPCTKTPSGTWYTHKGLILQWIYAGHQAQLKTQAQYSLEPDAIRELAEKMGVDPDTIHMGEDEE